MTGQSGATAEYGIQQQRDISTQIRVPTSMTISEIFDAGSKVKMDPSVLSIIKKMVRSHIFPKAKFITNRTIFDRPSNLKEGFAGHVMRSMGWNGEVDHIQAVYWNTYKNQVFKEIGQGRCTAVCAMKKVLVLGELSL